MGPSCGKNFVNSRSAGALDGVTIVEDHKSAETITDQNPVVGRVDVGGQEDDDKCSWIWSGTRRSAGTTLVGPRSGLSGQNSSPAVATRRTVFKSSLTPGFESRAITSTTCRAFKPRRE
jgi:hypothetical protein